MDNKLWRLARLARATARRLLPPRPSKHADPTYHSASPFAALLLKKHLRPTYLGIEDLLRPANRLRRLLALGAVPDHSTRWWFGRQHLSAELFTAAVEETVARVIGMPRGPRLAALDSTGSRSLLPTLDTTARRTIASAARIWASPA